MTVDTTEKTLTPNAEKLIAILEFVEAEEAKNSHRWKQVVWVGSYEDHDRDQIDELNLVDVRINNPVTEFDFYGHQRTTDVVTVVDNPLVEECGTAACFAGWTALLDGWKPRIDVGNLFTYALMVNPKTGETDFSSNIARESLGLTLTQSDILFDSDNTLEDLREFVEMIVSGISDDELVDRFRSINSERYDDDDDYGVYYSYGVDYLFGDVDEA